MTRRSSAFFSLQLLLISLLFAPLVFGQKNGPEIGGTPDETPVFPQTISVAGVKIHFVEIGQGPPLLFLHGLGGSWKDWTASLQFFRASYQVTAIDFPGFGDSDKPEVEYSIEWLTVMVERFLQERKLDQIRIVGHSMGALVALNLAARPDSRVKVLAESMRWESGTKRNS
jgi:alpha-beta hydrolase superfamily lysophospholipase